MKEWIFDRNNRCVTKPPLVGGPLTHVRGAPPPAPPAVPVVETCASQRLLLFSTTSTNPKHQ